MDEVYRRLSVEERDRLPSDTSFYVNAIVRYALNHIVDFGEALAEMIANIYVHNPGGERFILDPTRTDELTTSMLFLDSDGQLVTVKNPKITRVGNTRGEIGQLIMEGYQSYVVLTGSLSGKRFDSYSRPLPDQPIFEPGTFLGASVSASRPQPVSTPVAETPGFSIFLCHASEDKTAVRSLYQQLRAAGFNPWLDEENLLPGQNWDSEITKAVRKANIVLVCLSTRSGKRGYVQKEVVRALDVADEQPEGSIFLIPVRLEDCEVPDRLKRWQWVDLFADGGYAKLERALKMAEEAG